MFSKNLIIFSLSFTDFLKSTSKSSSSRCLPLKKVSRSIRAFESLSKQSPDLDFSEDEIWSLHICGKDPLDTFPKRISVFCLVDFLQFPKGPLWSWGAKCFFEPRSSLQECLMVLLCGVDVLVYVFASDLTYLLSCVSWSFQKILPCFVNDFGGMHSQFTPFIASFRIFRAAMASLNVVSTGKDISRSSLLGRPPIFSNQRRQVWT